jgi:tetratricopeptide (TPR) repeat protein
VGIGGDLGGKSTALYGRFSPGARERLAAEVVRRGGAVARDLTRRTGLLVVGALAAPLIDGGHLAARLAAARKRDVAVFAERRFAEALLDGMEGPQASVPLAAITAQAGLSREQIEVLAAFDIVRLDRDQCRFADGGPLKTAAELLAAGRSLAETVRILTKARDNAPKGRRKIVLDPRGQAALQWETGLTTLEGQGLLPLGESPPSIDDLFEAAAAAEAEGRDDEAARLYDLSARVDRKDPIACFNLGNLKLAAQAFEEAEMAFRRALSRDPDFAEARYNLAQAYERLGKAELARQELGLALAAEPDYADARFNLAQLELQRGALKEAKLHFELYLAADPPADWALKTRRAIQYCLAQMSA